MKFKDWLKEQEKNLKNDFYHYPRRKILFLILGIFILLFSLFRLWLLVSSKIVWQWDFWVVSQTEIFRNHFLDRFFYFVTNLGSSYFIIGAFLILAIFLSKTRRRKAAAAVLFTLAGSALLIFLFKDMFARPRPFGCFYDRDCFSFPSGHATISFYFYGLLFYLLTRFIKLKKMTVAVLFIALFLLVSLISLSRIYLGYHFPTDILGGFLLGGVLLLIAAILVDFLYQQ